MCIHKLQQIYCTYYYLLVICINALTNYNKSAIIKFLIKTINITYKIYITIKLYYF